MNDDSISRQAAIEEFYDHPNVHWTSLDVMVKINELPPAQPEIIYCKDCRKHNISPRSQEDCCPLYHYRGMSFGSEHDLQFCSYAERREE